MNYNQALDYIKNKESLGIMPGLDRIKSLLERMGNPQNSIKIIHIAGTNGKGTVAATIANALTECGHKTGLFTSPWILNYREQIQIDGKFISEEDFANYVSNWRDNDCSEFEFITAIMYKYFYDNGVDYAVIECGMGGKGDATNVEENNISVITSISLDHTDFLGKTIEDIAEEKSGILRQNGICFLLGSEMREIFEGKCSKLVTDGISDNISLANAVLKELNVQPVKSLHSLPARQEYKNGVLLDGGHNVAAAKFLCSKLNNETAIIGMMKDKDVEGYLSVIAPKCKKIIVVTPDNKRALCAESLAIIARKYCKDVTVCKNTKESLNFNPSLICGSFYLIREIYNLI